MSTANAPNPADPLGIVRGNLAPWVPWALAAGVAVVLAGLFAVTSVDGLPLYAFFFAVLFAAVTWVVSSRVEGGRRAKDRLVTVAVYSCFALAILPLVSVLLTTLTKGIAKVDGNFLTHSMRGISARDSGGGVYHAMIGTIEQVGIATILAVPIGLLTAIYLVEYGRGPLARAVTFFVDVMSGVPSIVAGLFIFSAFILAAGFKVAGVFGSLALAILMLPTMTRAAEEMLKLVPNELREASYALGVPRWRTIVKIVVPTALPGIITGTMLAIARVIGETAPLLLTTGFTSSINTSAFSGAQASLPVYVFNEWGKGLKTADPRAWGGALTLIFLVMLLNLLARVVANFKAPSTGR
jgi:phosphate transport system permease protein